MKKILLGLVFVGFAGVASAQTINFNLWGQIYKLF